MTKYMTPADAESWQEGVMAGGEDFAPEDMTAYVANIATHTLAADTLEYGVVDAAGDIVWFPVDATTGTAEDARQDAVNYAASDPFFMLVARRVSAPWEVTDEA